MADLVTIMLDKERHLRLTLNGMIKFQQLTGKNLMKGIKVNDLSLDDTAALVWACLVHEDKNLKYEDVLNLVDLSNLQEVAVAVTSCITQAAPTRTSSSPKAKRTMSGG